MIDFHSLILLCVQNNQNNIRCLYYCYKEMLMLFLILLPHVYYVIETCRLTRRRKTLQHYTAYFVILHPIYV